MEIKITERNSTCRPLFAMLHGSYSAQSAYVRLDSDGSAYFDYSGDAGNAMALSVYNGEDLEWAVRPELTASELAELAEKLLPLFERILACSEICWSGNNYARILAEDAQRAVEQVQYICDNTATEWYENCGNENCQYCEID